MLKKLALSLCLPLMLSTTAVTAAPLISDPVALMQSILQQERAWAGLETKTIKVEDFTFAYSEGGPKTAPTVLLVHGFSGSRDNWNRVARKLTKKYRVIALDLPGHGDTITPPTYEYTLANLSESVRKFVTAMGIQKDLNIAGHSLGGGISVLYSALYFLEVRSVLLVDTAGVYANAGNSLITKPQELSKLLARKPGDFERLVTQFATYSPPFVPKELMEGYEKIHMRRLAEQEKLMAGLTEQMKWYTPDTFQTGLRTLEAPVLVVWGDKDAIIGVEAVEEIKKNLKDGEYLILNDVGHTPILEADYPVSEAYIKFLDRVQKMPNKFAPATPAK
ncbi:alpha/beta fold hydrolase [Agitococcus lubricus]|uniref:Triacylglycerol lipase n=1 Tax=Agitococcus lubricus TaxID=1077255 RepID=A0A2T5J3K4_9GAMM|nr:alpha/beta hydrolase [Agitococcus lubricus]PTQ91083.1 triacylglycerol lipase [Agitococcus lubricus]